MFRKFTFSKTRKTEFANKMREVEEFLVNNPTISASASRDSFYFEIDGVCYRVSNHSIEQSNKKAFNFLGEQVRDKYHPDHRDKDTVYIHASKTRIIEIYSDIKSGYILDGRGNRKES